MTELSVVVVIVKCELGQALVGVEIPADLLGGLLGKEKAAEGCGAELGLHWWCG